MTPHRPCFGAPGLRAATAICAMHAAPFPNVPSLYELGYKLDGSGWFGLAGPRDLPQPIVNRILSALKEGYFGSEPQRLLEKAGLEPADEGPEQFRVRLTTAIARWQEIAESLGIKRM